MLQKITLIWQKKKTQVKGNSKTNFTCEMNLNFFLCVTISKATSLNFHSGLCNVLCLFSLLASDVSVMCQ